LKAFEVMVGGALGAGFEVSCVRAVGAGCGAWGLGDGGAVWMLGRWLRWPLCWGAVWRGAGRLGVAVSVAWPGGWGRGSGLALGWFGFVC